MTEVAALQRSRITLLILEQLLAAQPDADAAAAEAEGAAEAVVGRCTFTRWNPH